MTVTLEPPVVAPAPVEPAPTPVEAPAKTFTLTVIGDVNPMRLTWSPDDPESMAQVTQEFNYHLRAQGYWGYYRDPATGEDTALMGGQALPEADVTMHPQHVGG